VGTAVTEWNAKSLGRSDANIRSKFTGRNKESETQEICGYDGECLTYVKAVDKGRIVENWSVGRRILEQGSENRALEIPALMISYNQLDSQRLCPGFDDSYRLGMTAS
jgi:hypothetical protein